MVLKEGVCTGEGIEEEGDIYEMLKNGKPVEVAIDKAKMLLVELIPEMLDLPRFENDTSLPKPEWSYELQDLNRRLFARFSKLFKTEIRTKKKSSGVMDMDEWVEMPIVIQMVKDGPPALYKRKRVIGSLSFEITADLKPRYHNDKDPGLYTLKGAFVQARTYPDRDSYSVIFASMRFSRNSEVQTSRDIVSKTRRDALQAVYQGGLPGLGKNC